MPFTQSVGGYRGGDYLFQGLSGLGQGVGSAIKDIHSQIDEQHKLESYNDELVRHALSSGQITLEDYSKYRDMNAEGKTGFAAALGANFMEDFRKEQLASMQETRQASAESRLANAELRRQQAGAFSFEPTEEMKQLARATNNELVQTGPGKWSIVPYGGNGQDEVQTDPLKIGGKVIPGIGVNRKTGQYVYFPQDVGGGIKIEVDPQTGTPFYRDIKGNPKPLTGQQIMAGQMMPNHPGAENAQPQQGGGILDTIINGIFNSMGAPGPTQLNSQPSPTPAGAAPLPSATANPMAQPSGQKVKVKAPDGRVGMIPAEQLQSALSIGYQSLDGTGATNARQQAVAILQQNSKPVTEANIQAVIKKLGAPGEGGGNDVAPRTRVVEKNGHHYEVDDVNQKVIRQID